MRAGVVALTLLACGCMESGVRVAAIDFGVVAAGAVHHREFVLQNIGSSPAKLIKVERVSGSAGFIVMPAQVVLAGGGRTKWKVSFTGPVGLSEARFTALFDTGAAEFSLRARAAAECPAERFDLGDVRVGSFTARTFSVRNPLDEAAQVYVGESLAPFSIEPAGTLRLPPHSARDVTVTFAPTFAGTISKPWVLAPSADCTETRATLTGLAVQAPLSFSPGRLDFGLINRALTVQVKNHTRGELGLNSLTFSNPAFRSPTALPLVIPAEGVAVIQVEVNAPDSVPFDGVMRTDVPELSLPLLVNRTSPCLSSSVGELAFPALELGCRSADARVVVTNSCPHAVRLAESTTSPGFVLVSGSTHSVLAPGEAAEFAIKHSPDRLGSTAGVLTVPADVLDGMQVLEVALAGLATAPAVVQEQETIPPPQRDVLFVIDDSAAMLPLAGSVRRNLGDYARMAASSLEDIRVGVMTTSTAPGEVGRLRTTVGGASWLGNPSPAELEALTAVSGLSTSRSSCLEVLMKAFTPPRSSALNGMLRANTGLQAVCITNARDGLESAPMPAIASLLSSLPQPRVVNVVAHFVDAQGCVGVLEHGPLTAFARQSDGRLEEVCTPNWSASLDPSKNAFGYRASFYLRKQPDFSRGPLQVFVNEVAVLAENWQYESVGNFVRLESTVVPAPGQTVRFSFTPDCR